MTNENARQLGKLGGKASVKSRFKGKTKEQISEHMRKIRLSKNEKKKFDEMVEGAVKSLNKSVIQEQND